MWPNAMSTVARRAKTQWQLGRNLDRGSCRFFCDLLAVFCYAAL